MAVTEERARNFLLAGVGGQGTLLAADVVARVGLELGWDVKKSEIHGMAQRGGSVTSQVRWGRQVYSPLIEPGQVDYMVAFERLEALRYAAMLRPGGALLINDYRIAPVSATFGDAVYPDDAAERAAYAGQVQRLFYLPAMELAAAVGNARANNVVMLGALSALLPDVAEEAWLEVIAQRVPPRSLAANQAAFRCGRAALRGPTEAGR
jgi:indolepyruvate ferredoxin oxidoreductase beta subunit